MGADGAHLGVTASRALETILGGKPSPTAEEQMSPEDFAAWVRSAPHELKDIGEEDRYGEASRWLARRFLLLLEQCPGSPDDTWALFKDMWLDDTEEADLMTGFMHGWAYNAAMHCLSRPPVSNLAILTLEYKPSLWERVKRFIWRTFHAGLWKPERAISCTGTGNGIHFDF